MSRSLWLVAGLVWAGVSFASANESLPWDVAKFQAAPPISDAPAEVPVPEGVKALCFDGPPVSGVATKVFAYVAMPATASAASKVPGIVLIHGAGGTASAEWVKMWADRGYAAISIDDEGQLPVGKPWARNPGGGPRRGNVKELKRPVEEQWMYHAVADAMLAHSYLASLPEVDAERIGISGISWGAVVASTAAAVDARVKFAVPVYGCGFISGANDEDGSLFVGVPSKNAPDQTVPTNEINAWRALWDPANFLPLAKMPMLWISGATDFAFTPKARQQSYKAAAGPRTVTLFPMLNHSEGAGRKPEEIFVFADSVVKGGKPLVKITGEGVEGGTAWVTFDAGTPIASAGLVYTRDQGRWQDRKWETLPATVQGNKVSAAVPEGATAYYLNLVDERKLTVSGDLQVAAP